ncbi:hypothetical protein ACLOJK_032585 [Asimina triloba]
MESYSGQVQINPEQSELDGSLMLIDILMSCALQLVVEVKKKLEREYPSLPVGSNGRDDVDMIHWFLKDRKYVVEDAVSKLSKAIKWRQEFRVSELSEESVKDIAATGKAYLHDFLDVNGRPVLVVVASKHFPTLRHDPIESERLCVFLIEKALSKLPPGKAEILGIFDLRGFSPENGDIQFLKFLIDVFYTYYPKRLGQVLFMDAPFVFQPIWQLVKPWLKSYASLEVDNEFRERTYFLISLELSDADLSVYVSFCSFKVRFCSAEMVRKEYFTEETVPVDFGE